MRIGLLKLHVEESKFAWLYNLLTKIFRGLIQDLVVSKIQEQVDLHVGKFTAVLEQVLSHEMVRPVIESLRPTVGEFLDEKGNRRVSTIDSIEDLDPNELALQDE